MSTPASSITCVGTDVCFQVGRFAINSVASVESALVSLDRGPGGGSSPGPGDRGGRRGHGRGGRVGQRGVAALPARRVAALRVGRHGAELAVEVGEDPGHRHHVGGLEPQRLAHLPVLARPFRLAG